jgi:RNA polymerase sigma factor (sigma-70 family)
MLGEREEAADVAQETFARLCESGAVHEDPAVRVRWIYRTSTRLAIDVLRRRRLGVETRAPALDAEGAGPSADAVIAARQQLAAIASAAPSAELEVAMLCRVDGLTQPEAAEICDVSERTVRRLLGRFDRRVARLDGRSR